MKKLWAVSTAALITGGSLLGFATPALADGDSNSPSSTVTVADPAPTPDSAPVAAPDPTPTADPAPTPAPTETPAPPVVSTAAVAPVAAPDVDPAFDGWDTWLISSDGSKKGPVGHVSVGSEDFPQSYLGSGQIAPACNQYVQQDHYTGLTSKHDELVSGPLTWTYGHASDQDLMTVVDWTLVYGGDCSTPPPPPPVVTPLSQSCVAAGAPYTEDGAPNFTSEGQDYEGGSGHALNWLYPTTGNLQGFTSASYTIASASGYQAAYRFVLYQNGTTGYASVSAEPYMNGWTAGQTGTFTITPATLVWNSKILSGPGSQSQPVSITDMAALIPNNQFISQGIHLGSTAVDGQFTVVSAITGCVSYSAPPVTVTPPPTDTPTPPATPVVPAAPVVPASADTATVSEDSLAHTGQDVSILQEVEIAGGLMALGALLFGLLAAIRRRHASK